MNDEKFVTCDVASAIFPNCKTSFIIHPRSRDESYMTLVVNTGSARLQTYATPDELRTLAAGLLKIANEVSHAQA